METDVGKIRAAEAALKLEEFKKAEVVGIGTGRTVAHLISAIPEEELKRKKFAASSIETALLLKKRGAVVLDASALDEVEIYIDGADAVDPAGNMVKGGGAALFREKVLASMSDFFAVIVDEGKLVSDLRSRPIPIEVSPFALSYVLRRLREKSIDASVRESGGGKYGPVVSDSSGILIDLEPWSWKGKIEELEFELKKIAGIIETGLFIGMADVIIVGGESSVVTKRGRKSVR